MRTSWRTIQLKLELDLCSNVSLTSILTWGWAKSMIKVNLNLCSMWISIFAQTPARVLLKLRIDWDLSSGLTTISAKTWNRLQSPHRIEHIFIWSSRSVLAKPNLQKINRDTCSSSILISLQGMCQSVLKPQHKLQLNLCQAWARSLPSLTSIASQAGAQSQVDLCSNLSLIAAQPWARLLHNLELDRLTTLRSISSQHRPHSLLNLWWSSKPTSIHSSVRAGWSSTLTRASEAQPRLKRELYIYSSSSVISTSRQFIRCSE